jgi:hypothetical protein
MKFILTKIRKAIDLTPEQLSIVNDIEYEREDIPYIISLIRKYVKHGYPPIQLKEHWREIRALGNNSSSRDAFVMRYGEELGSKLFIEKSKKSISTKEDFVKKYGEEKANEILRERGASLENFIKRHGVEIGNEKWIQYCEKRSESYELGRKEKRYARRNLDWFINKHGQEQGYKIWDKKRKRQAFKVSTAGYVEKYGEIEGKTRIKKSKSRNLEYYTNKYGIIDGTLKYNAKCENARKAMSLTGFQERYGDCEGEKRWSSMKEKQATANSSSVSKWSLDCITELRKHIPEITLYGDNEVIVGLPQEWREKLEQVLIRPDLFHYGKIIEFQGDVFHGNPALFEEEDTPHPFNDLTTKELRLQDEIRFEYYRSRGWEVLEVWENDFKTNKEKVIEECIQFLNKKTK